MRAPRINTTASVAMVLAVTAGTAAAGPVDASADPGAAATQAASAQVVQAALRWQAGAISRSGLLTPEQVGTALSGAVAATTAPDPYLRTAPHSAQQPSSADARTADEDDEAQGGSLTFPAGDLDGNGSADVLQSRVVTAGGRTTLGVVARSGRTGNVIWTKRLTVAEGHFAFALPLNVGAPARPGVLVFDAGFDERANEVVLTDRLTALRGRDGVALWSHADRGSLRSDGDTLRGTHVPQLVGTLRTAAGADDLLLGFSDFTAASSGPDDTTEPTPTGSLDVFTIRAASGKPQRLGVRSSSATGLPVATGVSDLDGDRADDLVVSEPGDPGSVQARRATDGTALWQTALPVDVDAPVLSVGALSGARAGNRVVEDIAVVVRRPAPGTTSTASPTATSSTSPTSDPGPLPVPVPVPGLPGSTSPSPTPTRSPPLASTPSPTSPATAPGAAPGSMPRGERLVQLLRGSDGTAGMAVPGDAPVRLLKAGSPLVPALGTSTTTTSTEPSTSSDGRTTVTLRLAAYATDGAQLYARDRSLRAQGSVGFGFAGADLDDLQRDGSLDGLISLTVLGGPRPTTSQAVYDGATGVPVAARPVSLLLGSVTGTGSDLGQAPLADSGRTIDVRLLRGRDRAVLSRTVLRPRAALTSSTVQALAPRAQRSDVLVLGTGGRTAYLAVLDPAGKIRWSDEHALTSLTAAPPRR